MPHLLRLVPILIAVSVMAACASKNGSGSDATDPAATAPPTNTGTVPDTSTNLGTSSGTDYFANMSGASVPLTVDSLTVLNTYVGSHPINNPSNIRAYIELYDNGTGRFGGQIKIGYYDNGQLYTGTFTSQNPTGPGYNRISYKNWYVGLADSEFNQWFTFGNQMVFHGFFQDSYGAIVLVIDGGINQGDGGGSTQLSGKIYFKNFRIAPAPQYQGGNGEQCWFLLPPSPYECGSFKSGERVYTTSALYPTDGYTRLGSFTGLDRSKAFK